MCSAFLTTLRRIARGWYDRLSLASIHSFDQLAREFEANFYASAQLKPTVASLRMRQKEDEHLGLYHAHFIMEIKAIPDAHPSLVIHAFMIGIRPSRLFWSLVERPRRLCRKCYKGPTNISPPRLWWRRSTKTRSDRGSNPLGAHRPGSQARGQRELNRSCEPSLRPKGPTERQIDVIVGGPVAGGDSSSARKAYARAEVQKRPRARCDPKITFKSESEYPNHNDALVITARIANARVKRPRQAHHDRYTLTLFKSSA
ncbi:hypothetical protein BHM03_00032658 [Ensete ventricosum]|nr:hypothetical protein BHM03_00032658 [Ensete ventricosum]